VHLLDQPHRLDSLPHQTPPGVVPLCQRHAPRHGDAKQPSLLPFDEPQRHQVRPQPPEEPLLFRRVGDRNLDRPIEPHGARLHLLEQGHRPGEHEVVREQRPPEPPPPEFDLLRVRDFRLA